jgi:hypothetical protein
MAHWRRLVVVREVSAGIGGQQLLHRATWQHMKNSVKHTTDVTAGYASDAVAGPSL